MAVLLEALIKQRDRPGVQHGRLVPNTNVGRSFYGEKQIDVIGVVSAQVVGGAMNRVRTLRTLSHGQVTHRVWFAPEVEWLWAGDGCDIEEGADEFAPHLEALMLRKFIAVKTQNRNYGAVSADRRSLRSMRT